jgi:hypothetical protein
MTITYDEVQPEVSAAVNVLRLNNPEQSMARCRLISRDMSDIPMNAVAAWVHDLIPRDMRIYKMWEEPWYGHPSVVVAIQRKSEFDMIEEDLLIARNSLDRERQTSSDFQYANALLHQRINELLEERVKIWDAALDAVAILSDPAYTVPLEDDTEIMTLHDINQARQQNPFR